MVRAKKLNPSSRSVKISKLRFRFKCLPNLKYKQRVFFVGFFIIVGLLMRHAGHDTLYHKFSSSFNFFGGSGQVVPKKDVYQTKEVTTTVWTSKQMVRDPLGRMVEAPTTETTK